MAIGAALVLVAGIAEPRVARAITISFDDTPGTAPTTFSGVVPGSGFGPLLELGLATLEGGVIGLAITPADQAATTLPNLYATTDFVTLADGSVLPGKISGVLNEPASSIALDVGNGNVFAAEFTLTAFDGAVAVGSHTILLDAFASPGGFVGQLAVAAPAITGFTVTSSQPVGAKLFTVDTVELVPVPEPGTGLLMLAGVGAVCWCRGRKARVRS